MPPTAMSPARRSSARHRRTTDTGRLLTVVTRVGSLVTIAAVLVLGGATGALTAATHPEVPPTVRATNAH